MMFPCLSSHNGWSHKPSLKISILDYVLFILHVFVIGFAGQVLPSMMLCSSTPLKHYCQLWWWLLGWLY